VTEAALAFTPAHSLARLIRDKELSPVELVDHFLERISSLNPKLNAYLTVADSQAREAASSAEQLVMTRGAELPPLHGVPIAIKDLEWTNGIRTTMGSLAYKDFVPNEDSIAVERLRRAGAIILGKTNTCEFGMLLETKNLLGDDARNPWNTSCTTGGSSGGSAAATAAGLTPWATGSDSAGSIGNPAGWCGVFGLKPSHGRVPMWPNPGDSCLFLDTGPLTRTVEDAALMLSVIAGHDKRDPISLRQPVPDYVAAIDTIPSGLRAAWSPDLGKFKVDPEVRSVTRTAAGIFEKLGLHIEEATPSFDDPFDDIYIPIYLTDQHVTMDHLLEQHPDQLHPDVRADLETARTITRTQHVHALNRLWQFQSQMACFFENHEILLTPTNPVSPFPVGDPPPEIDGQPVDPYWTSFLPFLTVWNMTGHPRASVPCGFSSDGLPIGLQIVGRLGQDETVLALSAAFEREQPWQPNVPPAAETLDEPQVRGEKSP
jgi:aspartyl-tRNA(Asn)/glutamyl-tRNA(Gln) amidotransferase subunit A